MNNYTRIKRKLYNYVSFLYTLLTHIKFYFHGVKVGKGLKVQGFPYIKNEGKITLGNNVRINSADWANPIGGGGKTYFQVFESGEIIIGNNTGLSNTAITSKSKITIGDNVLLGSGCKIYDTDFHNIGSNDVVITKPISIQNKVFCGMGCIILKGVSIGEGSVIGAGSVVTKSIPAGEVWAGNPAKFIRKL